MMRIFRFPIKIVPESINRRTFGDDKKASLRAIVCRGKGFTLIELIMTIVVAGIVAIPLSLLVSEHIRSVFKSSDDTLAVHLAKFEMEKVNNMSYSSISSANTSNYEGYSYDVTRTVSYAYGTSISTQSVKKIQVDVKKSGSAVVLVSLITYIAKNVNYGI